MAEHPSSTLFTVAHAEPRRASIVAHPAARAPTTLRCLRCQLLGRRRLTCDAVESCRDVPHFYALGPILIAGWLATAIAFLVATW